MLDKAYDPKPVEAARVAAWEAAKISRSKPKAGAKPFTIVIPPPNVTGALHIGHALNNTLQDAFVRHHRMKGEPACWVPGADHGGIATQNVMEKQLKAEGKSRHDLGREAFLERMQAWTRDCKKTILGQLTRLGCTLDWDREAFTMDETRAKAVFAAFKTLWERGLVYRGERLVNWCVRCGTALSDIEVEREERKGGLYHIHYRREDGAEGVVVATTRPETMFGDTAVAVNPKDPRWKHMVGKKVLIPFIDRAIPVIEDSYVEFEFGTGALKVTPAHDQNDWDIGQRHGLAAIKAIAPDGKLTEAAGPYAGLSREKGKDQVIADLEAQGFLRKKEDHKSAVQTCYRCSSVIEPLLSWQWFVKQVELAKEPLKALDDGRFKIHPSNWEKPYRDWLVNIKDWCVSRQIWWGHQIPVWYCAPCNTDQMVLVKTVPGHSTWHFPEVFINENRYGVQLILDAKPLAISRTKPEKCTKCGSSEIVQDPDVLDTWFSSALWPLAVFGWPEKSADLDYYYPTSTLVTGYEILYLWVARMQMMGLAFVGKVPFADAVIHGIVRDKSGKKMSKSLGNVVDPLLMMDKYGTDALRFALMAQAHPGKDIAFDEQSVLGARNFVNKLWNSTRFVLMNLPEVPPAGGYLPPNKSHLELADGWIISRCQKAISKASEALDAYDSAAAAEALYVFLWDDFCDWYVELAKSRIQGQDGESKEIARAVLVSVLVVTLKALHPLMPFVTEELYSALKIYSGETSTFLLGAGYADMPSDAISGVPEGPMELPISIVKAIRSLRSQLNIPPGLVIEAVYNANNLVRDAIERNEDVKRYVMTLAKLKSLVPVEARPAQSATAVIAGGTFFIPLAGVIDFAKERERLAKDLVKAEGDIGKCEGKLKNLSAAPNVPADKLAEAKEQHAAAVARRERLKETLAVLS